MMSLFSRKNPEVEAEKTARRCYRDWVEVGRVQHVYEDVTRYTRRKFDGVTLRLSLYNW